MCSDVIKNNSIRELNTELNKYDKVFIITQQLVIDLCKIKNLINHPNLFYYVSLNNEDCKSLTELQNLFDFLIKNKCNKDSILIGIGGGTVTDLTGFAASVYMRGIPHIFLPTTLLAMVDASVGGKTAINYNNKRNIIGSFKHPKKVFIHYDFISTLNQQEIINGFAEIVKYALIVDYKLFLLIKNNYEALLNNTINLKEIIDICINHKINIVKEDFEDNSIRRKLNFGHTIGHALESVSNFKLSHGEAVFLGMKAALYISQQVGNLSNEQFIEAEDLINRFNIKMPQQISLDEILYTLNFDKKIMNNNINFILLNNIGNAYIEKNIDNKLIIESVKYIK